MKPLKVLSVVSEIYPLVKTGGLADVAGALPAALKPYDIEVTTLIPGYPAVMESLEGASEALQLGRDVFGGRARLLRGTARGLDVFVIDAPHLFNRPGNPYVSPHGTDWSDNALRFALLARTAARIGFGEVADYRPDIVHGHDWQAGLTGAYLVFGGKSRPATVFTIHNLAFQGKFPAEVFPMLHLPANAFRVEGVEYYGAVGYLKAGIMMSDRVTTVSPTYAAEIRTPEAGMGLDGLLRGRAHALSGVLNGIDDHVWNPLTDVHIPERYDARSPKRRRANKVALQQRFGLADEPDRLLFAVVSRLTWQKGLDLLLESIGSFLAVGAQLVVLGAGDKEIERGFRQAQDNYPGRIGVMIGYDEPLAHLMQAGADCLIVPSRFEPCGLTQLYALRYGAVPLVARVGGLADTVIDANEMARAEGVATGFQFQPVTKEMLQVAILRTADFWQRPEEWRQLVRNAMKADVSWTRPARHYAEIYRSLV